MDIHTVQDAKSVPAAAQSGDPTYRRSRSIFSRRGTQVQRLAIRAFQNMDSELQDSVSVLSQSDFEITEHPPSLPPIIIADHHIDTSFDHEPPPDIHLTALRPHTHIKRKPVRQPSSMCSASRSPSNRSQRIKTNNARIGVWVDGVTYWGESTNAHLSMILEEASFAAFHPAFQYPKDLQSQDGSGESCRIDDVESALVTPLDTIGRSFDASGPLSAVSPLSLSALGISNTAICEHDMSYSSSSSESERDDNSLHRHDSSATSDDAAEGLLEWPVPAADRFMPRSSRRNSDINKPLPPTPSYLRKDPALQSKPRRPLTSGSSHKGHIITQSLEYITRQNHPVVQEEVGEYEADEHERKTRSPTLSEAETDLRVTLQSVRPSLSRASSVRTVLEPPSEHSPILPRRSRKREWRASTPGQGITLLRSTRKPSRRRTTTITNAAVEERQSLDESGKRLFLQRSHSTTAVLQLTLSAVELPDFSKDLGSTPLQKQPHNRTSSADSQNNQLGSVNPELHNYLNASESTNTFYGENALLAIMATLTSIEDLHNMALVNRGMYRIFTENEMQLLSCVLFNASPPAAEFREWSYLDSRNTDSHSDISSSFIEQTPTAYLRKHQQDTATIEALKIAIKKRSASVVRQETLAALSPKSHSDITRIDDAFWRIWSFSTIFACDKDREDDLVGQLDWLRGGQLAKSDDDCEATVNLDLDFEHNSILLNPPEFFAKGNRNGLTSPQLFDMLELWTCLSALLDSYHGRVAEARRYGVFDGHNLDPKDDQAEHGVIEEWTAYISTLGPAVVLELATLGEQSIDAGFAFAQRNGWTNWSMPQYSTSRHGFLKDAVTRLYREQLVAARYSEMSAPAIASRAASVSQRTSHLAREIRLARHESTASMASRGALAYESHISNSQTGFSFMTDASRDFQRASDVNPGSSSLLMVPVIVLAGEPRSRSSSRTRPQPPPPPRIDTTCGSNRPASIVQYIPPSKQRQQEQQPQHYGDGEAYDTSTRAIRRLVDMGFLPAEAREALKVTDPGDGLRLDRAVEYLLQRRRAV